MTEHSQDFLFNLLRAAGPSGFESRPAKVWADEAESFAHKVTHDVNGNVYAALNSGAPLRVMLTGHIDEIGLQITHIDDQGLLYIDGIGGWDSQVLVGQHIRILGKDGDVIGVIGKKAIHVQEASERTKATELKELWIDIGARSKDEVKQTGIRVGDPAVIEREPVRLLNDQVASRAIDDRIGAYIVLEALRILSAEKNLPIEVVAVAAAREEIGAHAGAATSVHALQPNVAIAVDVTHDTSTPGMDKRTKGDHKVGNGPVLSRGSSVHPVVFEGLAAAAEEKGIQYSIQAAPRFTSTDTDALHISRNGVAAGLVSIPNRYMHSPSEVVSLKDLDSAAQLIAAYVKSLAKADATFLRV